MPVLHVCHASVSQVCCHGTETNLLKFQFTRQKYSLVLQVYFEPVSGQFTTQQYMPVKVQMCCCFTKKTHMLGEVSIHQTTVHIFFFPSMSFTSVITVMSLPRNSSIHLGYKCVMWLCDTGVLWLYGDKPSDIPKFA